MIIKTDNKQRINPTMQCDEPDFQDLQVIYLAAHKTDLQRLLTKQNQDEKMCNHETTMNRI